MLVLLEGLCMCLWLLLICVVGIADGPVGLVVFYEPDVQNRVIELGLTTRETIRRRRAITAALLFLPLLTAVPAMVYLYNGAQQFREGFLQLSGIYLIMGLFDRIFIDWYWVGHTRAWIISGTEDLMPYIPKPVLWRKWLGTLIGFPLLAAIQAAVFSRIF